MKFGNQWRVVGAVALLCALVFSAGSPRAALASVSLTTLGAPYTQNFDSLANSGNYNNWTNDVTLPGWYYNFASIGYFADDGSRLTGDLYSFGTVANSERALGSISSSSRVPIDFGVRLTNNTQNVITSLDVAYTGEQWRNSGATAANTLAVTYRIDDTVTSVTSGSFTAVPGLNFTSLKAGGTATALDGNDAQNRTPITGTITGLQIYPGQEIILRWEDVNDAGNDHGLAIDDLTITPQGGPVPAPADPCPVVTTDTIGSLQGTGDVSPVAGQSRTVQGRVVGDFQALASLEGYFVQDAGDANDATSDGIFVVGNSPPVAVGDLVQVTGTVIEQNGLTQLSPATAIPCSATTPLTISAITLDLPAASGLERYESMLVSIPETLTVTENFQLGRFGELVLSTDGRLITPTNVVDPTDDPAPGVENDQNNKAAVTAAQAANNARQILLDDGSNTQNPATVPYLNAQNTRRIGDTVANLTGVLSYGFSVYRIQPTVAPQFADTNPRPTSAPTVGGDIKVASFNVLNYFNTVAATGSQCYPGNTQTDCRGANSALEFQRQRSKIITAINTLNADIVGLIEIENDGDGTNSALQDLVDGLNQATAPGTYALVSDPDGIGPESTSAVYPGGDDAIKTALIYKPASVSPIGLAVASPDAAFGNARAPIAQTFEQVGTTDRFSVVINHFKSKSGTGTGTDADQNDGQGSFNASRVAQAQALANFITSTVVAQAADPDVLVLGDLNAYNQEDPIDVLRAAGLGNLIDDGTAYSYVFGGQSGSLDHALATTGLQAQVTGAAKWHINADEPLVLDYNTEFKSPGVIALNQNTPYRSSDHDPVLIGINLGNPVTGGPIFATSSKTVSATSVRVDEQLTYTITVANTGLAGTFSLTDTLDSRLQIVSAPAFTRNGQTLTASGSIGPNTQQTFVITARAIAQGSGPLTNSATLTGDGQTRTLTSASVSVEPGEEIIDFKTYLPLIGF